MLKAEVTSVLVLLFLSCWVGFSLYYFNVCSTLIDFNRDSTEAFGSPLGGCKRPC